MTDVVKNLHGLKLLSKQTKDRNISLCILEKHQTLPGVQLVTNQLVILLPKMQCGLTSKKSVEQHCFHIKKLLRKSAQQKLLMSSLLLTVENHLQIKNKQSSSKTSL